MLEESSVSVTALPALTESRTGPDWNRLAYPAFNPTAGKPWGSYSQVGAFSRISQFRGRMFVVVVYPSDAFVRHRIDHDKAHVRFRSHPTSLPNLFVHLSDALSDWDSFVRLTSPPTLHLLWLEEDARLIIPQKICSVQWRDMKWWYPRQVLYEEHEAFLDRDWQIVLEAQMLHLHSSSSGLCYSCLVN
jgi:hypothetical protein